MVKKGQAIKLYNPTKYHLIFLSDYNYLKKKSEDQKKKEEK